MDQIQLLTLEHRSTHAVNLYEGVRGGDCWSINFSLNVSVAFSDRIDEQGAKHKGVTGYELDLNH